MARSGLQLGSLKKAQFVASTAFTKLSLLCRMYSLALLQMRFSMKINVFVVKAYAFTTALYPSKLVFMLNNFVCS